MASATNHIYNTEQQLVAAMQAGNKDAVAGLYHKYAPLMLGFIAQTMDEVAASEVLQNVFLEIWSRRLEYNAGTERLFTWIFRLTRAAVHQKAATKQNITNDEIPDSTISVDKEGVLKNAPSQHPPEKQNEQKKLYETVFDMMYVHGLNINEVAEKMQANTGDIKKMLRCAMNKFKDVQHG